MPRYRKGVTLIDLDRNRVAVGWLVLKRRVKRSDTGYRILSVLVPTGAASPAELVGVVLPREGGCWHDCPCLMVLEELLLAQALVPLCY